MNITYWTNFSKRTNSTKQPTGGTQTAVRLKEPCGISSPTFICSGIPDNVKYIQAFGRYYFVSEVTHNGGLIEISCTSDPLATYKSAIGATSAMIDRSASAYNSWISDGEVVATEEIVQNVFVASNLNNLNTNYGLFVVRVTGKNGAKNYLLAESDIQSAFNTWYDINAMDFSDLENSLKSIWASMSQPAQYIQSIKWFPFTVASLSAEHIYYGFIDGGSHNRAGDVYVSYCDVSIPARYYNDVRDYDNRFTKVSLFVPGYGSTPIDAKYLESTLRVRYSTDVDTGNCEIDILSGSNLIFTAQVNIAADIPFGGIAGGGSTLFGGIAQIIGSLSITPLHTLKNAISGAENAVSGVLTPPQSNTGANGNRAQWQNYSQVLCCVTRLGSTGKANTVLGQPLREYRQISTLSGYVLCNGASVDVDGFDSDREAINGYLNSGFYYE